ncbi:methyl-accepting chemotaxis protein [Paenibacillus anaericanus]|uniref:Methyl-accepting chemotaxis protein n=1 Tax=Paenibacillus anaericanus TaxID=170367 RepID=A0A433Y3X9_9BACL|nr:methyl-accepting chemotaxis protein [Paenibacillus anaericanus]RUT42904.1 methyl-accepting chemotaxis protein [Paenibacillus anaericanus]
MKWFYNLKTTVKLVSAFVIVSIILGVVGLYGISNLNKMDDSISDMYANRLTPISDLSAVNELLQLNRINIRDINTMAKTPDERTEFKDQIQNNIKEIGTKLEKYGKTDLRSEEIAILNKLTAVWESYTLSIDETIALNETNISNEDYTTYLTTSDVNTAVDEMGAILKQLISVNTDQANQASEYANKLYLSSRTITIAVIVIALIVSVSLGYIISQVIARPLNRVVLLLAKVAKGDLSETSDMDSKDEIGLLAGSVNDMILNLRQTVGGILVSAETVSAASQQISASTEEIASGSMSQAGAAQTMNELFRELSLAINSVAHGAEQASELSDKTMSIAQDGGKVIQVSIDGMTRVNEQMSRLEEDSNKIGEIIEVIDDIAEQTNLLALNAAIEAARAGDQGRGFAVVADEVRKLAERSSEATKQITKIIKGMQENTQQSVKAVEEGVASSQKTGEAFEHILSMVNETAYKVTEIAAASEEQAAQSSEVLDSIESISAATEEVAASSGETAATAQSLAQLAEELNGLVTIFKIK